MGLLNIFKFKKPTPADNNNQWSLYAQKMSVVAIEYANEFDKKLDYSEKSIIDLEVILDRYSKDIPVSKPTENQIEDLIGEINERVDRKERVLVTTLTKKMAESLTEFFENTGIKVRYMHHDIDTMERMEIIRDLRLGEFDVLVGINLLREGLDIPEVSLVAILDADKEGFLRSETSLVQTIGRAARNANGQVIMYADSVTDSMEKAITETNRRRGIQMKYNEDNNIVPKTIIKDVRDVIEISGKSDDDKKNEKRMSNAEKKMLIDKLTKEMKTASKMLEFEHAAYLRDRIAKLKSELK